MNICYVTSYYDIGRDSWDGFTRTFDEYLRDFEPFITLFNKDKCGDDMLIVFIDDKKQQQLIFFWG